MARRQTLDPGTVTPPARLGPSDSSDSGSDLAGTGMIDEEVGDLNAEDTSDRGGTGEGLAAGDSDVQVGGDIAPDRIIGAEDAGLGGGLDQAEEAQLGVTDEELARRMRRN